MRVAERANPTVVGTYRKSGRDRWLEPDDNRLPAIRVTGTDLAAAPGEKVVVALSSFPRPGRPEPEGAVVERLGTAGEPDVETLAIIRSLSLRDSFPAGVLAEAEALPREVLASDMAGRLDLRGETVFTIDDAEARDLDDAVSLTWAAGGSRRLGVHIADVAHYVAPGSALDIEARRRGTSVYLADRVLPMLPPRLSNGIASLHPGVDRLTMSVFMDVDRAGRVTGYEVSRSVIRSVARLTYDAVAAYLRPEFGDVLGDARREDHADGPDHAATLGIPEAAGPVLRRMAGLAGDLRRRRMARGSLDFDIPEEKVLLDDEGRPLEVVVRPRNIATQLIEEFMLAANEAVADYLLWHGLAYISRVHEEPFPDDLEGLRETLAPLGYRVPTTRVPRPAELRDILEASRGRPEAPDVHKALLKALPQARYSAARLSHYALASPNYLHFTSPIRRYPDLDTHRRVASALSGTPDRDLDPVVLGKIEALAKACSVAERVAERAEVESLELKKTELAHSGLGELMEGEVTEVFRFGAFVRLPMAVEGLVPATERGVLALRAGQRVTVQIVRVDLAKRQIELALTE